MNELAFKISSNGIVTVLDEKQYRAISLFPSMMGVVALAAALLVAEQGLDGDVDIHAHAAIG